MRPPKHRRRAPRPSARPVQAPGTPVVLGVCWYRQDQYERFLASANDREDLEDTWAEWQITAERVIRQYRAQGLDVRKVESDLDDLLAYCAVEGKPNTAATRAAYVTHLMERQEGSPA
jgi:hypothetical protein